jgi:hypothetical protein
MVEAYPPIAVRDCLHADRGGEAGLAGAERLGRTFRQLVLPLRDLVRVDVKLFRKLRRGFSPLTVASATLALNSGE